MLCSALLERLRDARVATVLVIEDVHWADDATLDSITVLGRRIGSLPAVLVVTYRGGEAPPGHPLHAALVPRRRRDHHAGRQAGVAHPAKHRLAIAIRQHEVQDDAIRPQVEQGQTLGHGRCGPDLPSVEAQQACEDPAVAGMIARLKRNRSKIAAGRSVRPAAPSSRQSIR